MVIDDIMGRRLYVALPTRSGRSIVYCWISKAE